ncbi:MAG: DNA primase [Epsilonproteobacteria bacterium]|nr:DNA primase [Campylobacterota bacterium]
MITQDSIEALKARLDIVDVVGSYVELRKAGANYKAPCPFHDEKTASFVVSPAKQIYHCFGCGAGGDSVKFVMEHEKLSYPEALEKLASSYNFTLHYSENKKSQFDTKVLDGINEWYKKLLFSHAASLSYLRDRGVGESSIERFGIGYAPDSQMTLNFLKSNFYNLKDAIDVGVIGGENGRYYARFIERITFPIHSANGSLVGFGGRTITGHQAKYVNSPETKLFNKSRLLYAYHHAKQSIHKKGEIIITEGYLDVVMLHQAGFENAVATLGTALTHDHLPLLRKGEPKVLMAYDGDKAGRAAALKAARLLSAASFSGGVILFEGGLDPADMVKNGSIEELNAMFKHPKSFIEFVIDETIALFNLSEPKEKERALAEVLGFLKTLSPLMQEEYKSYSASRLGISPSYVKLTNQTPNRPNVIQTDSHRDTQELSIIKSALERPFILDSLIDFLDRSVFTFHGAEFDLLLKNQLAHPSLVALSLDESIHAISDEEELKRELAHFLMKYYERELKKINFNPKYSFEEKAFYIRKFRDKITRLKRGELVSFS